MKFNNKYKLIFNFEVKLTYLFLLKKNSTCLLKESNPIQELDIENFKNKLPSSLVDR
jgi:hypothetical protein